MRIPPPAQSYAPRRDFPRQSTNTYITSSDPKIRAPSFCPIRDIITQHKTTRQSKGATHCPLSPGQATRAARSGPLSHAVP